jgi:eukaryotic-like serine/threonine-protein kinase
VPFGGDSAIEIAMKHVNELPRPPSQLRSEIPPELDQIVLRALAKEPEDRYQTAEEFIEDLERLEAGLPISRETSEAATALLAAPLAGGTTEVLPGEAATRVAPPKRPQAPPRRPPPPEYRYEEPPRKRRRFLPWLLVLLLLAAAGIAGWYVYNQIQEQLEAREPVGVPNVVGLQEERAVRLIENAELEPNVERQPSNDVGRGIVISQNPDAGVRIQKGDQVTIVVSSGPRQVEVPGVVGMNVDRAIQELDDAGLDWRTVEVFSEAPVNQVVRQNPQAGQTVDEGTRVTLRVSQGVETAVVPDVLQQSEGSARQELQAEGFEVQVNEAPSDDIEEGLVSAQDPSPGVEAPVGSTVTITVSTGPEQVEVPSVEGEEEDTARQILEDAGFQVQVEEVPGPPPDDGTVVDQDPDGGTEADRGSTVTIVVARFVEEEGEGDGE